MTNNIINKNSLYNHDRNMLSTGNIFTVFAVCAYGLSEALSEELKKIGFSKISIEKSGCIFNTNFLGIQYANLYSRIASRILLQIDKKSINNEKDIINISSSIKWNDWFDHKRSIKVKTIANNSDFKSLQYCNLLVKDGICDFFRKSYNVRPNIDKANPDIRIYSYINKKTLTLYIDTSGESLFKRGWRINKGDTPLKENLAAGLLYLSGWDPNKNLLDPFCGSGTIIIEAAHIAHCIPPGIHREFAFEKLVIHNINNWKNIIEEAKEKINNNVDIELIGCDIDNTVLQYANYNLHKSGIKNNKIKFISNSACDIKLSNKPGFIVTNPPYGERIPNEDIWYPWSHNLKENFFDWSLNIISSDMNLPRKMHLKPKRKIPIFNGKLECRLFKFDIVKNNYIKQNN